MNDPGLSGSSIDPTASDPTSQILGTQRAAGSTTAAMPGVVAAAATQPDSTDLAQASAALKWGADTRNSLEAMDAGHQAQAFGGLSQDQQKILVGVGYKPVPANTGGVGGALERAVNPGHLIGDVLGGLGVASRAVKRVANTGLIALYGAVNQDVKAQGITGWSAAWKAAGDPNFVLGNTNILKSINTGLDPQFWDIALDQAKGYNAQYLMGKYGVDQATAAMHAPGFDKAVSTLTAMKPSVGRTIALSLSQIRNPMGKDTSGDRNGAVQGNASLFPGLLPGVKSGADILPGVKGPQFSGFNLTSGAADATWTVLTDPVTYASASAGDLLKARYAIKTAEDVDRISQLAGAQRGLNYVASLADDGNYGQIARQFPAWQQGGMIQRAADFFNGIKAAGEAVDSTHVVDFLRNEVALTAVEGGSAGRMVGDVRAAMPHLSALGPAALALKDTTSDALNRLANSTAINIPGTTTNLQPIRATARFLTGMSNLYLRYGDGFDPLGPESPNVIRQVGRLSGLSAPQTDELVNDWVNGDLSVRRNIYKATVDQAYASLGSDFTGSNIPTTPLGEMHAAAMGALDKEASGAVYGHDINGNPVGVRSLADGSQQALGLYEHQLTQNWHVPDLGKIAQAQWQTGVVARSLNLLHVPTEWAQGGAQAFMRNWKLLTIMRPAMGVRVGGEEAAAAIMRDGLLPWLDSKQAVAATSKAIEAGASSVPDVVDWIQKNGQMWSNALDDLPRLRAAQIQYRMFGEDMVPPMHGITNVAEPEAIDNALQDAAPHGGALPKLTQWTPTGDYKSLSRGNPYALYWWQRELQHLPESGIHMAALKGAESAVAGAEGSRLLVGADGVYSIGGGSLEIPGSAGVKALGDGSVAAVGYRDRLAAAQAAVEQYLLGDGAGLVNRAGIAQTTLDGGIVGVNATQEDAIHDWAREAAKGTLALTHSPDGAPIRDVIDPILAGQVPGVKDLANIDPEMVPKAFVGREVSAHFQNPFQALGSKFFEKVVDPVIANLSRQPILNTELAKALTDLAPQEEALAARIGAANAAQITEENAVNMALDRMSKFIHNPEVRSQFEQMHPSLTPFWFAKRQFYERWGRTLAENPLAVRGAQLTMNGLRDMGVVTKDQNGEDIFSYPATGIAQKVLATGVAKVFGGATIPVTVPFTSKVKYLSAGTADGIAPGSGFAGFGPFVGMSLSLGRTLWPELGSKVEQAALGDQGAGQGVLSHLLPSWARSLGASINGNPDATGETNQLASAMNYAIASMAAAGQMPAENAPAGEQQQFISRVRQWARTILLLRAGLGLGAPAAPSMDVLGQMKPEYLSLLSTLPINEASAAFMKMDPNATPWTVFQTTSESGGMKPLPADAVAGQFLDQHAGFVNKYGATASWFIPSGDGNLDSATWNAEFAAALRVRKTPEQFSQAVDTASDATVYYQNKAVFQQLSKGLKGAALTAVQNNWSKWKDAYLATRPVFADQLAQAGTRATERANALDSLTTALADPRAPQGADTAAMSALLSGYNQYKDLIGQLKGQTSTAASSARKQITGGFLAWAGQFTNQRAVDLFNQLIGPDVQDPTTGETSSIGAAANG